ncbi:Uncharacterized protein LHYA1_G002019 [Lachnellula hyalina]|uniref:FAD-binding domain-containing protein n=1 Tax=Lachnellula hyalina TaxID=1316788 RepID=A0A8H8R7D8_9HELO|nr:Uncharacterized protein LHYA1_G002019 [Lachnellula hyalina]TVY29824.1 Uncharacterized protein LHYA1_G002019 [Lachnellula hyalina]
MSKLRVLISGASVAGPALAYWLVRAGCSITIIERAPSLRSAGQGIDVRDTARDVIKRMGIFDIMRAKSSQEEGIMFVDSNNRPYAEFGVDDSGEGDSMTCDIEILRGELAKILFDVTKDDVEYIFGDMVESLQETGKDIVVSFASGTPERAFDLVVGADGIGSSIRGMAFGREELNVRSLNAYVSYFSIPKTDIDTLWSRVHWITGGRNMVMRPDNMGRTRAFLSLIAYSASDERLVQLGKAAREGIPEQKAVVQELFQDGDWEIQRMLEGMHESDDFYMQYIGQVRLDRWSSGRVTVVGDAGYAPSPFSGMGTSLAFLGAYVLAGEISKQPDNIPAALLSYERILRPHVESIQNLPPGIPWIVNPQSMMGVRVLETFIWGVGWLSKIGVTTLASKITAYLPIGGKLFKLPEYEAFNK